MTDEANALVEQTIDVARKIVEEEYLQVMAEMTQRHMEASLEAAKERDAIIKKQAREIERLREALEPFTFREDGDDEAVSIQHPSIIVRCEVTYGDIQLARAALEARRD
jgi:predicted ArsR family transcriptional regulator